MQKNQRVADMAVDVLARQAGVRAGRTGEPIEEALKTVLETEAGRQLGELRDGPHGYERAQEWQEDLPRKRAEERSRARDAAWKSFMQAERRELQMRKDGQLAGLLAEPLPGESPAGLRRLVFESSVFLYAIRITHLLFRYLCQHKGILPGEQENISAVCTVGTSAVRPKHWPVSHHAGLPTPPGST